MLIRIINDTGVVLLKDNDRRDYDVKFSQRIGGVNFKPEKFK